MNNLLWQRHFETNERRPVAVLPPIITDVPREMSAPLVDSLRTFQAGETGEGRVVGQARAVMGADDPAFAEAMRLYVAEEGRHARELGLLLRSLGAGPAKALPTARIFGVARSAIGLRTKMAVLTAAEVVGIVYYDLLAEKVPSAVVRRVVRVIVAEERAHVVFQRDYFQWQADRMGLGAPGRSVARAAAFGALGAAVAAATLVFVVDQRALLRALGVTPRDVALRAAAVSREALQASSSAVVRAVELVHTRARDRSRSLEPWAAFAP